MSLSMMNEFASSDVSLKVDALEVVTHDVT